MKSHVILKVFNVLRFLLFCNRELYNLIDVDKDNKVSNSELYDWIEQHMKKHVLRSANTKITDLDKNKDGKVSWEEYKSVEFNLSEEEG